MHTARVGSPAAAGPTATITPALGPVVGILILELRGYIGHFSTQIGPLLSRLGLSLDGRWAAVRCKHLRLKCLCTFENGIGDRASDQTNRANGLVVAWNDVIDIPRITIRIHDGDRGDTQAFGLTQRNAFLACIDGEQSVWQAIHPLNAH